MTSARSSRSGLRRMRPRDPFETIRSSSPLELFFDLVFVVAVSRAAFELATTLASGATIAGLTMFAAVFFAIWWAWVNFTWFASAFDIDDWGYRLLTLTQMLGVIVLAIGVTPAASTGDFRLIVTGYVLMRLALVAQWLRASRSHPSLRLTAHRYATCILAVQLAWVGFLAIPQPWSSPAFLVLVLAELVVPVFAERPHATPWHAGHIVDRYGSFTMIVLGESMLSTVTAIAAAQQPSAHPLIPVGTGILTFALVSSMWWIYFSASAETSLTSLPRALIFGYGHYFIFAAIAAFSASIGLLVTAPASDGHALAQSLSVSIALAAFLTSVWAIILRHVLTPAGSTLFLIASAFVAWCGTLPLPLVWLTLVMIALTAVTSFSSLKRPPTSAPADG